MRTASSTSSYGDHRQHRSEDLLLRDAHGVVDVGEHRGAHVPAAVEPVGHAVAADDDAGALLLAEGDVLLDALLLTSARPSGRSRSRGRRGRRPAWLPTVWASASTTSSYFARLARMRVCATQAWPLFISAVNRRPSMVAARSASSSTIAADLPPSSRLTRLSCSPHTDAILRPAAVEPVNATLSMPGWATRCSPTSRPAATMLTTPGGHAGLLEQLGHQVGVERGLRRRLEYDGAAGQQRRGDLGDRRELGDVPGRDRGHHARPARGAR